MTDTAMQHNDLLAVHSIDEFVFSVPDLEEARRFYTSFGLHVQQEGDALALYTYGHSHRWARIFSGVEKRLLWLSLGIYEKDASAFEQQISAQGIQRIAPPAKATAEGLWMEGPDEVSLQLKVAPKTSPSQPSPREFPPESCNYGRSPGRSKTKTVQPLYMSHILLFSADVPAAIRFYEQVLGFKLSDKSGDVIGFMHTPHGSDHHLLALAKSDGAGLHHSSWCVPSIDAVGLGAQQMVDAGYDQGWGMGRHILGSNYFRYVRDPWGSYAEYSFDIDFVEPSQTWPCADHAGEDALYVWGPAMPPDFIKNYEL